MSKTKADSKKPADHRQDLARLKRIRGQVEGVERMIQENRYCLDIVNQIRSIQAALRSTEALVMDRHIRHCVADAIQARDPRLAEEKINELLKLLSKR